MKKRHRLDERARAGRLGPKKLRAVAQALAAWHRTGSAGGVRGATGEVVTPVDLARRARNAVDRLGADLLDDAARAGLWRSLEGPLEDQIDLLLERLGPAHRRRLHGGLDCRGVWVDGARRVELAESCSGALGDPTSDLAALATGLTAWGRPRAAEQLVAEYAAETDDFGLFAVLAFYEQLAACEAAASAADRARAAALTALALKPGRRLPSRALLIAVGGPVASRKSTVARGIGRRLAAPWVEADRVCEALLEGADQLLAWEHKLVPGTRTRLYAAVWQRAEAVLGSGRSVVIDACFPNREGRSRLAALAAVHGIPFVFVECRPGAAALAERLARRDARDGRPAGSWREIASSLDDRYESPGVDELGCHLAIETSGPIRACVDRVLSALSEPEADAK